MAAPESENSFAASQPIHQYIKLLSDHERQQTTNTNLPYVRTIILKSLSDPAVYAGFTELKNALQSPSCNIEGTTSGQLLLRTLDLFSHGCFLDYKSATTDDADAGGGTFVKLNEAQETKLKLLTIITVVQQTLEKMGKDEGGAESTGTPATTCIKRANRRNRRHSNLEPTSNTSTMHKSKNAKTNHKGAIVQYSTLQSALGINEEETKNRILENLLIKCIYTNLLPAGTKLDQKNACLLVKNAPPISSSSQEAGAAAPSSSSPSTAAATSSTGTTVDAATTVTSLCRDINVQTDIPDMISKLETMYNRSEKVKAHLMESLNKLNNGMKDDVERWKKVEESIQLARGKVKERKQQSGVDVVEGRAGGAMAMMALSETGQKMPSKSGNLKRSRGGKV